MAPHIDPFCPPGMPGADVQGTAAPVPQSAMLLKLAGVPKPALQVIFEEALGRRIWEELRAKPTSPRHSKPGAANGREPYQRDARVTDADIIAGMVGHLSRRAGAALRERGRQAKAIGLTIRYADGCSKHERMELARPTNDQHSLAVAARQILGRALDRGIPVESLGLSVTSLEAALVGVLAAAPAYGLAPAITAQA